MKKRTIALLMAVVMLFGATVAGTLAWLKDDTDPVVNTFTVGNIDIELDETTGSEYKMIPGSDIEKDPFVTVKAGSEASYVFVEIEESANFDDFMTWTIADGWTLLERTPDDATADTYVYYRIVGASDADQEFAVLSGDKVTVLDTVTKEMMDAINAGTAPEPTLTFTAYAVQSENVENETEAWGIANA